MAEPEHGAPESRPDSAERLFAEFLARQAQGPEDFDHFVQQHPAAESELRRLDSDWRFFQQSRLGASVLAELSERAGANLDPGCGGPEQGSQTQQLLERLNDPASRAQIQVVEPVGAGGQGEVYKVWDRDLRRYLALKVLTGGRSRDVSHAAITRFLEEAQVTGQLTHPGVVPVHGLGIDERNRPYYTMPLVDGQDLQRVFERCWDGDSEWTTTRVLGVLLRVCETMAFAHKRGVIHRDLKPGNVMVGRFGEVYVVDWGLARVGTHDPVETRPRTDPEADRLQAEIETRSTIFIGTPGYGAPEQFGAETGPVDARSDIWALGAMLYALLQGAHPYREELANARTIDQVQAAYAHPPRGIEQRLAVPPELQAITERALAREVRERYEGMTALADDLRAFLENRVVQAYRTGPIVELTKWVRRNRGTAAGIAATLTAVFVAFVWSSVLQARSHRELLLTSDGFVLDYLVAERERLTPLGPAVVPETSSWFSLRDELLERLPAHAERASSEHFATDRERQRAHGFVERVRSLIGTDAPLFMGVQRDYEHSRTLEERSVSGPAVAAAWREAVAAIADEQLSPAYAGLALRPQMGLIPIGRDPVSGFWEFAHIGTGSVPERSPDGRIQLTPQSGLVFVLLPGGRFSMGVESELGLEGFMIMEREGPVHEVEIGPYFLSKYEMNQAQWSRAIGSDSDQLLPQADVDWRESMRALRRHGLTLPTEAQWECAARCGSTEPWWFGRDPHGLIGHANLAGQEVPTSWPQRIDWLDDGYFGVAPVNGRDPSPWGFHDVYGNVWEWCLDSYGDYTLPVGQGDGRRISESEGRVARGGSWLTFWAQARAAARGEYSQRHLSNNHGLRPARAVE